MIPSPSFPTPPCRTSRWPPRRWPRPGAFVAANEPPTPAIVVVGRAADWRSPARLVQGAPAGEPDWLRPSSSPPRPPAAARHWSRSACCAPSATAGVRVASAKVGPDYIDPRFHEAATGRPCYNLDPWAMSAGQIARPRGDAGRGLRTSSSSKASWACSTARAGRKGSTADLAADAGPSRAPHRSTAAIRPSRSPPSSMASPPTAKALDLAGVILNRVASDRHEAMLREALGPPGIWRHCAMTRRSAWPSRHLGLVQAQENQAA